jgi:hypothetical protein
MANVSAPPTESSVAELLARALQDEELWSIGERPPDDPDQRESLAARALSLYDYTAPLYAERVRLSWAPLDTAIYVLRMMIGDRCAILSGEWEQKTLRTFANIPARSTVERWIRQGDVPEWAAQHGYPLQLLSEVGADEHLFRGLWRARISKREMVKLFYSLDEQYERLQELRNTWPVWVKRRPALKKAAAGLIATGHNNLLLFGKAEDRGAYVVATPSTIRL